jgi:hypothetical protein
VTQEFFGSFALILSNHKHAKTQPPAGNWVWSETLLGGVALLRRLPSREALLHFRHGGSLTLNYLKDSAQGSCSGLHLRKALSERNFLVHK